MRITKEIAEQVARLLCTKKKEAINAKKKVLAEYNTVIYLRHLPDDIVKAFKKKPNYFNKQTSTRINGSGLGYEFYQLDDVQPTDQRTSITASEDEAKFIVKASNEITDLQIQYNEIVKEIEAALYNLRTYNNVEKEFPEAFALLPPTKVNTGLMVNLKDIRCKLGVAPC
jgi:hypothetical protein